MFCALLVAQESGYDKWVEFGSKSCCEAKRHNHPDNHDQFGRRGVPPSPYFWSGTLRAPRGAAHRALALRHHPDKQAGQEEVRAAEEAFREVQQAYELLSKRAAPSSRRQAGGEEGAAAEAAEGEPQPEPARSGGSGARDEL